MTAPGTGGPAEDAQMRCSHWPACQHLSVDGCLSADPSLVEQVAAKVHEAWMETKRAQGVESRPSEWGEEQMVPYADLTERAKDLDRSTVQAVFAALETVGVDLSAAAGSVPGDGGEALRREVERLCDEADQRKHTNHLIHTDLLRAALSAAPVGGRSQDEQTQPTQETR